MFLAADGSVPLLPENGSWSKVADFRGRIYWTADGARHEITDLGVSLPAGALDAAPAPSPEQQQAALRAALTDVVQTHVDAPAQAWGYDSAASAVGYVGDPFPQFDAEGRAIQAFRSECWQKSREIEAVVAAGARVPPTKEQLLFELPSAPTRPVA